MAGEEEEAGEEAGQDLGLAEDHSVIYHHGKDQDGYLEEAHAGTCSVTHGCIDMDTHIIHIIQLHTLYHHIRTTIQPRTTIIHGDHTKLKNNK